jgi:hypothetical protein
MFASNFRLDEATPIDGLAGRACATPPPAQSEKASPEQSQGFFFMETLRGPGYSTPKAVRRAALSLARPFRTLRSPSATNGGEKRNCGKGAADKAAV